MTYANTTVKEFLDAERVGVDTIAMHTSCVGYWDKVFNFIQENEDRKLDSLSSKQIEWLFKIREYLIEARIENK